jgi:hypothetical protein
LAFIYFPGLRKVIRGLPCPGIDGSFFHVILLIGFS